MILSKKRCSKCRETKSIFEFSKNKSNQDGLQWECKKCCKKRNDENPDRHLLYKYGITAEFKQNLVQMQNNCCAICNNVFKNTKDTHVDHCHTNKNVRGLLCSTCNTGIGMFKDDSKLLQLAIKYLENDAQQNKFTSLSNKNNSQGCDGVPKIFATVK